MHIANVLCGTEMWFGLTELFTKQRDQKETKMNF